MISNTTMYKQRVNGAMLKHNVGKVVILVGVVQKKNNNEFLLKASDGKEVIVFNNFLSQF